MQLRHDLFLLTHLLIGRNLVISFIIKWILFILIFRSNLLLLHVWRRQHQFSFLFIFESFIIFNFVLFILIDYFTDMAKNVIHIFLMSAGLRVFGIMTFYWGLIYPLSNFVIYLPVLSMRLGCRWHSLLKCAAMNLLKFDIIWHLLLISKSIVKRLVIQKWFFLWIQTLTWLILFIK